MGKDNIKSKQNPQLKRRHISGGRSALYLEYYEGRVQEPRLDSDGKPMFYPEGTKMAGKPMYVVHHNRHKEELKLYLTDKPKSPEEREQNREIQLLAEAIRQEREQQRLKEGVGYRLDNHRNDNILAYFEKYLNDYTKKDKRNISLAINRFKAFIRIYKPECASKRTSKEIDEINYRWAERHKDIPGRHEINENEYYRFYLRAGQFNKGMAERYKEYLVKHSSGEGAATCFSRFKKIVKFAYENGMLKTNPCEGIKSPAVDKDAILKDILTVDEIKALVNTHYPGENPNIRRAFITCLYTGVRWCDVKDLTYNNVDYTASLLSFTQKKTEGRSQHAGVKIPLSTETLTNLIGKPEEHGKTENDLIFDLPSHTMCNKALSRWASRAGINKHITWHCARHTFATLLVENGNPINTVVELMGQSGLQYIMKYAHALDKSKRNAINGLPSING